MNRPLRDTRERQKASVIAVRETHVAIASCADTRNAAFIEELIYVAAFAMFAKQTRFDVRILKECIVGELPR